MPEYYNNEHILCRTQLALTLITLNALEFHILISFFYPDIGVLLFVLCAVQALDIINGSLFEHGCVCSPLISPIIHPQTLLFTPTGTGDINWSFSSGAAQNLAQTCHNLKGTIYHFSRHTTINQNGKYENSNRKAQTHIESSCVIFQQNIEY